MAVEVDDDEGRILLKLLRCSLQQNSVKEQSLTPGWRESVMQHLNKHTRTDNV